MDIGFTFSSYYWYVDRFVKTPMCNIVNYIMQPNKHSRKPNKHSFKNSKRALQKHLYLSLNGCSESCIHVPRN